MITTALVGDLFIVMDPNGELVTTVGGQQTLNFQQIFSLLVANSGDYYDTMSCYLDTGSGVLDLGDAADTVYQDVTGIGRWTFDFRSQWSSTRLQHFSYYSFFDLVALLQEFGHRWGAFVNYATTPNTPAQTLLHQDWVWTPGGEGAHWGRWFDKANSSMDYDQAEWIDNGNGTYNRIERDTTQPAQAAWFGYCPLDQYLMGLVPDSAVAPLKIIQNPSPTPGQGGPYLVSMGPYTPNPGVATVTIAQVQNPKSDDPSPVFSGPRNPDYLSSQRVFHNAIVVVTKNTSTATTFITNSETWRQAHTANVRKVTSGRMMVDTSLLRSNFTDIYVKDNAADTGAEPSTGMFWETPDLVTRNADDNVFADQPVIRNQDNWIYVQVRNKGTTVYANVTVNVYLQNFAGTEFLYPVDWAPNNLIGTATIASLPAASGGNEGTAIAKFLWSAAQIPPAAGWHPCLLVEVIPMEITPSGLHHVWDNRKLAQKNVTIIDMMRMMKSLLINFEFAIGHPLRKAEGTHLQLAAEGHISDVRLFLDPAGLVEDIAGHATKLAWDIPLDPSRIPSGEHGVQEIDATHAPQVIGQARGGADGLVIEIDRGTEIGVGGEQGEGLRLRFEDDVRIRVGGTAGALEQRYAMRGLRPVVLNGLPLLEITDSRQASLSLPLPPRERRVLRLYAIVTRPLPHPARYQITERLADRVIGGVTLQLGV
jgi:hypothetical protein